MKKFIMATVIAACIALCAAVWPQSKVVKETPVPPPTPAVCATEAAVAELKTEVQTTSTSEKEKEAVPPTKAPLEIFAEPELAPGEIPTAHQEHPTPEPEMASEATPKPAPEPTHELPAVQPTQMSNMVYVEGFGWIESQGPNYVEYAADMLGVGALINIAVSVPSFAGTYHIDAASLIISCRTRWLGICMDSTSFENMQYAYRPKFPFVLPCVSIQAKFRRANLCVSL